MKDIFNDLDVAVTENRVYKLYETLTTHEKTPISVLPEIIANIELDGKDVVTVNLDVFLSLREFKDRYKWINPKSLTLVTDVEELIGKPDVIYVKTFKEIKLNKHFDVAILNPPYTLRNKNLNTTGGDKHLGKRIATSMLEYVNIAAVILPQHNFDNLKISNSMGLYSSKSSKDYFGVRSSEGIRIFFFDKTRKVTIEETESALDYFDIKVPNMNLSSKILRGFDFETLFGKTTRNDIEIKLNTKRNNIIETPIGAIRVYLSAGTVGYTYDTSLSNTDPYINTYRVFCSDNGPNGGELAKFGIALPGESVSSHNRMFVVDTLDNAQKFKQYLESPNVTNIIAVVKQSTRFTNTIAKYIPIPDFLK
jgi:hypothetical protein